MGCRRGVSSVERPRQVVRPADTAPEAEVRMSGEGGADTENESTDEKFRDWARLRKDFGRTSFSTTVRCLDRSFWIQ